MTSGQWSVLSTVSGQYNHCDEGQSVVSVVNTDDRRMCCRTLAVSPFACLVPHTAAGALGVLGVRGRVYNT